ncbi:MAG: hypothetical protein ACFFD8_01295, partial [Candidatus Thorarchaeota archaeon]
SGERHDVRIHQAYLSEFLTGNASMGTQPRICAGRLKIIRSYAYLFTVDVTPPYLAAVRGTTIEPREELETRTG